MREGEAMMARKTGKAAAITTAIATIILAVAFAAPAFAQSLANVEPTLGECRAFVEENGVPQTRPVWENRGYSGWDVCLSMAYDGDLDGYFASNDRNGDGKLGMDEQRAYMDSVIGPVSDPDQSPLNLDRCRAMISEHGIPAERPFVDWSNRGYGEAEICQSLAFDGNLEASFATADSNADGRLDRSEQSSYVASVSRNSEGAAPETPSGDARPGSQDENAVNSQYGNAAEGQYGNAGDEGTRDETAGDESSGGGNAGGGAIEETTPVEPMEPTISAVSEEPPAADSTETAEPSQTDEPEKGVLSAVNDVVQKLLPDTGGVPLLGVLGGVALVAGGFLAYRLFR